MARLRTIKPEFFSSPQIAECSTNARLAFIGMWCFADDAGIHPASTKRLKMEVFPADPFSDDDVSAWVAELETAGLIETYSIGGADYWRITGWSRHQKIDRPTFRYPPPPPGDDADGSTVSRGSLDEDAASTRPGVESSGVESKGVESNRRTPTHKTRVPDDFQVSDRVKTWAARKGFDRLEEHLEAFKAKCAAKGYTYADHDAAFMEAIREDWAKLRIPSAAGKRAPQADNFAARDYGQGGRL